MTIGFNCKTTFWYFLCILWCKNFHDDDDDVEDGSKHRNADDVITAVKEALNRIFGRIKNPDHCEKKKTESHAEKSKQHSASQKVSVEQKKDSLNGFMKSNGVVLSDTDKPKPSSSDWIIGDLEDNDDDKLQYPVNYSDDDSSSISDFVVDKCGKDIPIDGSDECGDGDNENILFGNESIVPEKVDLELREQTTTDVCDEEPLRDILQTNASYDNFDSKSKISETFEEPEEYHSTSFIVPSSVTESSKFENKEKPYSISEDFWDLADPSFEEPSELIDAENELELVPEGAESSTKDDNEILRQKIKCLIPLKPDQIDLYLDSAIAHFHRVREELNGDFCQESLVDASKNMPNIFTEMQSNVTEIEIGDALLDSSKQSPYIDKRIIFHLVCEIFSEIYSSKRCLPQVPWANISLMVKKKNYTLWKGDQPPESYDLVSAIVSERVYSLLNQNTAGSLEDGHPKRPVKISNFNIIKWCDKKQKEKVDEILTRELRADENEWVMYDEAEMKIKFKIADDIFNYLLTDTISWMESLEIQTEKL